MNFNFLKRNVFDTKEEHPYTWAFKCGGIDHYEFEDINNLMCGRAFAAIDFYNELGMKCTREFLQAHCAAVQEILNPKTPIDIFKLNTLNVQLQERLDMVIDSETIYKIASVVFFDKTEKPYSYDFKYGQKKIERWKKEEGLDFFLRKPIRNLIPALEISDKDFLAYMKVGQEINREHLGSISTMLSSKDATADWYKTLNLANIKT